MTLTFIFLHFRWIATELYYYEWTWNYTLFPFMSGGLQRSLIITCSHGIRLNFLICKVDCNEIKLLRVDMAFHCISLNDRWIATKLYYYEYSWYYILFPYMSAGLQLNYIIAS